MLSKLGASPNPSVEVYDLAVGYGGSSVLSGVNLTIAPGEVHVILGGSGCGKSTLLRAIVGLERPTSGSVKLLGAKQSETSEGDWEKVLRRVGMLFQGGALINSLTVGENVALPLVEGEDFIPTEVIEEMVVMKLALVGLEKAIHLTPPQLSGGMRKRVALARAMVLDPEVLFCDEPSAGLDPVTAAALDKLILGLRDRFGMAVVVVTHELASIEAIADKVTMLAQGGVVASGSLKEVRSMQLPIIRAFFDRLGEAAFGLRSSIYQSICGEDCR